MLIKPKTSGENLHQTLTLVVSGATVRFIYGEACTCRHARPSVYLCGRQMKSGRVRARARHADGIMMLVFSE